MLEMLKVQGLNCKHFDVISFIFSEFYQSEKVSLHLARLIITTQDSLHVCFN